MGLPGGGVCRLTHYFPQPHGNFTGSGIRDTPRSSRATLTATRSAGTRAAQTGTRPCKCAQGEGLLAARAVLVRADNQTRLRK